MSMIKESQISTTQTESPYVLEDSFMGKFIGMFIQSDNGEYYFDPKQGNGWLSASDLIIIYDKLQELNSTLIPNQQTSKNE